MKVLDKVKSLSQTKAVKGFKSFFSKHKKLVITLVIVIVLAIVGVVVGTKMKNKAQNVQTTVSDVQVTRRDVKNAITGTASIVAKDSYEVKALVSGDILEAPFEEGDIVEKGTLLYKIGASSIEENIESAKLNVEKSQVSYNDAVKSKNDLTTTSNVSGKIKTLYVKVGDNIQAGGQIADVYSDSVMKLKVPFNVDDANRLRVGEGATITMTNGSGILRGSITAINGASEVYNGYALVKMVTIEVSNPGTISPSDKATAMVGSIACNDAGTFSYITEASIVAKSGGEIKSLPVSEGQYVSKGQTVLSVSSDTIDTQIENARLSLQDAKLNLQKAQEQLDDYTITAPIAGTVVTKTLKAGDVLDNTTANTAMAVIYDMSELKFDMSVDELNVNEITVGQAVTVTADAISDKTYNGVVEKVSVSGTTENGVTTYPVTVKITDADEQLLPGMNLSAEIVVEQAENALTVPISAVQRGDVVYVKGDKTDDKDKAPDGYKSVSVETGLSDDEYVEIKSGLKESDKVRVETVVQTDNSMQQMMGGGMGGGSGAPFGGGAPSGGGSASGGKSSGSASSGGGK